MAGKSLNRVTLIGNAGKDAELRYTGAGKAVATFTVATNESWKDKTTGQMQERAEWHNIVAWERLAEICGEYVKKGGKVYIDGRIQSRSYDDKEGQKRYITEIVANDLILLDGGGQRQHSGENNHSFTKPASAAQAGGSPSGGSPMPQQDFDQATAVDDLPF